MSDKNWRLSLADESDPDRWGMVPRRSGQRQQKALSTAYRTAGHAPGIPDASPPCRRASALTSTSPDEPPPPVIPSITPGTRTWEGASTVRTCWWTVTGRKIDRGALDERHPAIPRHEEPHRTALAGLSSRRTMAGTFQAGGALWRGTGCRKRQGQPRGGAGTVAAKELPTLGPETIR